MLHSILWSLSGIVLTIFGLMIFWEFMWEHQYYNNMFADATNWALIGSALISALIPWTYLTYTKKYSLSALIKWIGWGLVFFSVMHVLIKDALIGSGLLMLIINVLLLFSLSIFFVVAMTALGSFMRRFLPLKVDSINQIFFVFWWWLGVFILINFFLQLVGLYYPLVTWLMVVGLVVLVYRQKIDLTTYRQIIEQNLSSISFKNNRSWEAYCLAILLVMSIVYYYYGFNLSFIPYPTARDANHAYMYTPKIIAENNGVLWWSHMTNGWMAYIAFWFSLIQPIKSRFWLSPDTFGVSMNFISGLFVLVFSLALFQEVIALIKTSIKTITDSQQHIALYGARFLMILWLTSWMGAFLVFVDNKTDLWVFAMTILALLSGVIMINYITAHTDKQSTKLDKTSLVYAVLSAFFFALAVLAKPTAFLDAANFGLLTAFLWLWPLVFIGGALIVFGAVAVSQTLGISIFFTKSDGMIWLIAGSVALLAWLVRVFFSKKLLYLLYLLIWVWSFVGFLVVFKWPYLAYNQIRQWDFSVSDWAKWILLWQQTDISDTTDKKQSDKPVRLLATTEDVGSLMVGADQEQSCSLKALNITEEQLFSGLKKPEIQGLGEDVGRYVGYGARTFTNSWWSFMIPEGCHSFEPGAKRLCQNQDIINAFDVQSLQKFAQTLPVDSRLYQLLTGMFATPAITTFDFDQQFDPRQFQSQINLLNTFWQEWSWSKKGDTVMIPYKFLIPFNIVFNRSLQNLSSYYTDIGFIWLFVMFFVLSSGVYSLFKPQHKLLQALSRSTIFARWIWWLIGGAIFWYGIGLVIWSCLTLLVFFMHAYDDAKSSQRLWVHAVIIVFVVRGLVQWIMNMIRISSQWAWWPFIRYKMNNGYVTELNTALVPTQKIKYNYRRKDVFDLQFPHYNAFIDHVKDRADDDGVLIAWTYLQYFLHNQKNLFWDGMLTELYQRVSDFDMCKASLRLKHKNIRYLVIDPNIASVVMGDGNSSLMDRFFAKLNPVTQEIEELWTMTALVKMIDQWHLRLFYSNNLGAKYAYSMPKQDIRNIVGDISENQMILLRARMASLRFFPQYIDKLFNIVAQIFTQRIQNGDAIKDIADVYGKSIDEEAVRRLAIGRLTNQIDQQTLIKEIETLTQDERLVLSQYLGAYNFLTTNNMQWFQNFVQQLLTQSIGGSSQLIVLERIDK